MSQDSEISVVIPSYNGEHTLQDLLKSLEKQTFREFDVIMVVDGSIDNTAHLKELNWDLNIKWIFQENKGRSGARNTGAFHAIGKLLLFLDCDTIPEQDVVAQHVGHHQRKENSVLVGSVPVESDPSEIEFNRFRQYLSHKWLNRLPPSSAVKIPSTQPFLTAAHFSISKELFFKVGGFDTKLRDSEDYEFAIRLSENEVPVYFDNTIKARHMDHLDIRSYLQRLRDYRHSRKEIQARYTKGKYAVNHFDFKSLNPFKRLAYRMVCNKKMLTVMEKPPGWVKFVPESLRFRIYDLVVTGYSNYFPYLEI